ncbi:MAG: Hexaprenyldihydroxybenzoate methyltransferase, mitochondrial [Alectoria fallacina]|uniref:Ubiquinone biosynthesis O-methyltransferase, mitochondrial n=1 Tax=Alectoria fallacina TaxID=1903189 RepID=A0A8H3J389_9LECA|nr:MAG: Hexaprenyldihydroxybenzoate methyltransferase, mitochondrial [Alectoria fallacina]
MARPTTPRILSRLLRIPTQRRLSSQSSQSSSVNAAEVSHFDSLASTWWDPYGSSGLLHQMNPLRHDFISSCLESQPDPTPSKYKCYLDVGCGGGIFAESAARLPWTKSVVGIDPSNKVISIAKAHARQDPLLLEPGRLEYQNKAVEDLPVPRIPEEQFDIVSLFEVIEHIKWPAPFLSSCLPFVKPGGWLILSTIARTWTSWLTTNVVAEEVVRLVPRGTHDWSKYINEQELRRFFRAQNGWGKDGGLKSQGCMYVPAVGWRTVASGEKWGNYFFGVRKDPHRE